MKLRTEKTGAEKERTNSQTVVGGGDSQRFYNLSPITWLVLAGVVLPLAVAAVGCGVWLIEQERRGQAIEELKSVGCHIETIKPTEKWKLWLREKLPARYGHMFERAESAKNWMPFDSWEDNSGTNPLPPVPLLEQKHLDRLARFPEIKKLILFIPNEQDYPFNLSPLGRLEKVEDLSLCLWNAAPPGLAPLENMKELKHLWLHSTPLKAGGDALRLKSLPKLETLRVSYGGITDEDLSGIECLSNLQTISFKGCSEITDAGMEHIGRVRSLRYLYLDESVRITDKGLEHLAELTEMENLILGSKDITPRGVAGLNDMKKMNSLWLWTAAAMSDEAMAVLKDMNALEKLGMRGPITDAGLVYLKGKTNLNYVMLGRTNIVGPGLADLPPNIYKELWIESFRMDQDEFRRNLLPLVKTAGKNYWLRTIKLMPDRASRTGADLRKEIFLFKDEKE